MSPESIPNAPGSRDPSWPLSSPRHPRHGRAPAPRRGRAGAVSTSVRFCPLDPHAGIDDTIAAVVRMLVAAYTAPGARVALADADTPTAHRSPTAREHRDRLIETVLRLGRGATAEAPQPAGDASPLHHDTDRPDAGLRSGSGLGPGPQPPPEVVAQPTPHAVTDRACERCADRFGLILFGCTSHPADPSSLIDWAPYLAANGTLIVLTHSNHEQHARAARSGSLRRIAALANLALTDRLILAHHAPSAAPPASPHAQRAVALGGHHRIHTTASVFRPIVSFPEARVA